MHSLILTLFLLSPVVSKNPVEQDTLAALNIHLAVGIRPANDITKAGPELGAKLEYLLIHPVVIRTSVNYTYSGIADGAYPLGDQTSFDIAAEAFVYRGRRKLTAYLGMGVIYSINGFEADGSYKDTVVYNDESVIRDISKIEIEDKYGYRFTLGLRVQEKYAFELGFQETRPNFLLYNPLGPDRYNIFYRPSKLSTLRFTFGYVIPL